MKKYIISIALILLLFVAFLLMLILTDTPMNLSLIGSGYEERTRYPENEDGQNAFELYIEYEVQEESDRNKVREIMADPNIKALIDSIRYEPDVCEKILNGN